MLNLLLPLGLLLQTVAFAILAGESAPGTRFLAFVAAQSVASAALAPALLGLIPVGKISRRREALAYLFALNLAMPVAGIVCLLGGYHLAKKFSAGQAGNPIAFLDEPVFSLHRDKEGSGFRGGEVRARLMNPDISTNKKMGALVSIQDTPARVTKDILRGLLADPSDDIRLLAYGILDSKEKRITRRILDLQMQAGEVENRERPDIHRQIAELHWELIYQNLVQGDMRTFSADQVRHHAALGRKSVDDGGLWFLLARLELLMGRTDAAEEAIAQAGAKNFPNERLLPYFAELRFLQRRFRDVRATLSHMATASVFSQELTVRYWLGIVKPSTDADFSDLAAFMAILKKQSADGHASALPTIAESPKVYE